MQGKRYLELDINALYQDSDKVDYRTLGTAHGDHWQDILGEMIEMEDLLRRPGWIRRRCEECENFEMSNPIDRAAGFRWGVDESKIDTYTGEAVKVCLGHRRGYDWLGRPSRPGVGVECLKGCSVNGEIGPARVCLLAGMRAKLL